MAGVVRRLVVGVFCLLACGQAILAGGLQAEQVGSPRKPLRPLPGSVPEPADNPSTPEKVALGAQLFFDPRLSGDNSMSCASCHQPEKAFGDGLSRGEGREGKSLPRNTPTLLNVGFHTSLFWDGRATSLEEQSLLPIQCPDEMNQDLDELEKELNAIPGYVDQFQRVFATEVTREGIAHALAAFQRTLITGPSPLDRYLSGEKDALSSEALFGMELFLGDAGCVRCHQGPLLSDGKFYRLGVSFVDSGRSTVSGEPADRARFRTPSLRNVAQTGPYMHNGSLRTLFDVVEFYLRGVSLTAPSGLEVEIEPVTGVSYSDISALVAFLEALSGEVPQIEVPELP